jgi:DnaJ domain
MTQQFRILGIKPTRNLNTIKRAYRAKALLLHPDKGGSAESFRELTAAYDYLVANVNTVNIDPSPEHVYRQPVKPKNPPPPPPPPEPQKVFRTIQPRQLMDDSYYDVVEIPQSLRNEDFILFLNWRSRGAFKMFVPKTRKTTTRVEILGVVLNLQLVYSHHLFESTRPERSRLGSF